MATNMTDTSASGQPLVFTDAAATKVAGLIREESNPNLKLRVFIQGGGCSGFQYGFTFDENEDEGDTRIENCGVTLLVDPMSIQYLLGLRDRLSRGSQRGAVRDPQPERLHHLRLRVVVRGLSGPKRTH
jgi:iron-sulfur cluster insertion protein